jgi:transcriptional regulator with XRE-family HTH domain
MAYHPIDVQVGTRLRQRRALLGISQAALSKAVGLSFQQLHKYECGSNQIGASRLFEFAEVLDVPVSYFFKAMPAEATPPNSEHGRLPEGRSTDPIAKRETLELVRAYRKISDTKVRKAIVNTVRSLR